MNMILKHANVITIAAIMIMSYFYHCECYKPVVVIHGVMDRSTSLGKLAAYIQKEHPGTNVTVIDLYHGWRSVAPLWRQVYKFANVITAIMNDSKQGIHMIGYSQGGLIGRGVLSLLPNHTVDTFISLSSPQMGQYGDTDVLQKLFPEYVKANLYKIFYKKYGQVFSVANYWNDPHHQDLYRNFSAYLAVLNNETTMPNTSGIDFKSNFLRLNHLILIGGPDDDVITPWQSSQFGFYNADEEVVQMEQQWVFKEDSFGLQTLKRRKAIYTYTVPGVKHVEWHENYTVFENCILPWLT